MTANGVKPAEGGGSTGRGRASDAVVLALATGAKVEDAAASAGVGTTTVYMWLRKPTFRARVQAIRGELYARAAGRLADEATRAADVLAELMGSSDERVRLAAATRVIEAGARLRELVDLTERVAAIEAAHGGQKA